MSKIALVTGADRGLGLALTASLLEQGWRVFAGQYLEWPDLETLSQRFPETLTVIPMDVASDNSVQEARATVEKHVDSIDLVILNAAMNRSHQIQSIHQDLDFESMQMEVNTNAIGSLRVVHAFLPLIEKSHLRRLCFVSSEAGSIGASKRTGWFGYCMSKAALNMAVKNLHNDLHPQDYSFRLYHPGYLRTYMSGQKNMDAHMEPEEGAAHALRYFLQSEEPATLCLRDWQGNEYPW